MDLWLWLSHLLKGSLARPPIRSSSSAALSWTALNSVTARCHRIRRQLRSPLQHPKSATWAHLPDCAPFALIPWNVCCKKMPDYMASNVPLAATKGVSVPVPDCWGDGDGMRSLVDTAGSDSQPLWLFLHPDSGAAVVTSATIVYSSSELMFPSINIWVTA